MTPSLSRSIFGKVQLGYVLIETEKFSDWRRFGSDAIGMHYDDTSPDAMRFRLDTTSAGSCCSAAPPRTSRRSAGTWTITRRSTPSSLASGVTVCP